MLNLDEPVDPHFGRDRRGYSRGEVPEKLIVESLPAFVLASDPGLRIQRKVQTRDVAGIGLISSGGEKPQFVFCDRTAESAVDVVHVLQARRIRQAECLQAAVQVVTLETTRRAVREKRAVKTVAPDARNQIALHADARRVAAVPGNLNVDLFEQ